MYINNASRPFLLVFKQSFDPSWQVLINGSALPETDHFVADDFANSWVVAQRGNFSLILLYDQQPLYDALEIISLSGLIGLLVACIAPALSSRKQR